MSLEPIVHPVFEKVTATWQYIVACPETKHAAIIDPVLDFDPSTLTLSTASADHLLDIVREQHYVVDLLLETHAHADHLTAAGYLQRQLHLIQGGGSDSPPPPATATGHRIRAVQTRFAAAYHVPAADLDAAFERLFADDEPFRIGHLSAVALHLPGHTPDHSGYRVGDAHVFVGDSLFLPDVGTARCDFPDGSATALFGSAAALLALPPACRLYAGHDYPPAGSGREPRPWATVEEQRRENKHVKEGTALEEFVRWREGRDGGLGEPRLLHPALQTNIRGGKLAETKEGSGLTMLWMPVKMPANF